MSDGLPVSSPIRPSYAPICVPVYAPGLTDRSELIRSSACSADPADVELVSQHFPCPYIGHGRLRLRVNHFLSITLSHHYPIVMSTPRPHSFPSIVCSGPTLSSAFSHLVRPLCPALPRSSFFLVGCRRRPTTALSKHPCLALEDNAISSSNWIPHVKIGQLPLHTK